MLEVSVPLLALLCRTTVEKLIIVLQGAEFVRWIPLERHGRQLCLASAMTSLRESHLPHYGRE